MARARAVERGPATVERGAPQKDPGTVADIVGRDDIEEWPIGNLRAYERNARQHPPAQIEQLRHSLRTFGQVFPVLVREDGTIVCGHGRVEAARQEGFKTVRVVIARGWSEAQCRQFGLLDNRISQNADWNRELLTIELADLKGFGVALDMLGFSAQELARLVPSAVTPEASRPRLDGLSYAVIVRCTNEAEQGELLARFEREGLKCEALIS
jgi:ParB-like chromosome segregation protein Spo0J